MTICSECRSYVATVGDLCESDAIAAERAAGIDRVLQAQHEQTLARIDAMSDARRAAIAACHPVIATDGDPTPAHGIQRGAA